jgi:hypothetical protein
MKYRIAVRRYQAGADWRNLPKPVDITEAQIRRLRNLAASEGIDVVAIREWTNEEVERHGD